MDAKRSAEREELLDAGLQAIEAYYGVSLINQKLLTNPHHRQSLEDLRQMMERRVAGNISPSIDLQEVVSR